jgi:hypothetical protein
MLWPLVTALVSLLAIVGGYVYWQYRTAAPPALGEMPSYRMAGKSGLPLTDVPEAQRAEAEARLRNFASTIRSGYKVANERFLAAGEPFIWDAVCKDIGSHLAPSGYVVIGGKTAVAQQITYVLYRHDGGLRRRFNDDMILAAVLNPRVATSAGGEVTLYGYFRLTRN